MNVPRDFPGLATAPAFLGSFDPKARARGEKYFHQGRVISVTMENPNRFSASVRGTEVYNVLLTFNHSEGWSANCSCPLMAHCKHVYAAMKALLAESSAERVRQLSEGVSTIKPKQKKKASRKVAPASLAEQLEKVNERPLTPEEKLFIVRVQKVYARCAETRSITLWNFDEMGLKLGGYSWEKLHIWPAFPPNERLFWLYVANALRERGKSIPAFMSPVSDTSEIEEELVEWRRRQDISRWKQTLESAQRWPSATGNAEGDQCELRARFGDKSITLEWRQFGQEQFEPMKTSQARQLREDIGKSSVMLSTEAEWLWDIFSTRLDSAGSIELPYAELRILEKFGRLFRMPAFERLLVNPDGEPFERPATALRWHLDFAETEEDDYRLRVTQADGSAVPAVLCVIEGRPALYVTRTAVFRGPPVEGGVLAPNRDNIIPAPAMETRAGAALLHSVGLPFPPRLQERVQTVPLHLVIRCALKEGMAGSNTEVCAIEVLSHSPKGALVETWNGYWSRSDKAKEQALENSTGTITLYDRSALRDPRSLLLGLEAKWDTYQNAWAMRVTKKFPELFSNWIKSLPPEVKLDLQGELASLVAAPVAGTVRLDVEEKGIDWFDLRVVLDVTDVTLSPAEIKLLLDARGGYVRLKDKGWRKLQFNLSAEEDEQMARLGLTARELTSEPQRLHALQLSDPAAKKFLREEQFEKIERRVADIKARVTPGLPGGVNAQLRPYQTEGYHFLAYLSENRFGGILADDMGLGKTLQALTWLSWLRSQREANNPTAPIPPVLVVCPKSVMDNWRVEVGRFTPGLRVKSWSAGELNDVTNRLGEADIHVLNYNQLRSIGEALAPVRWLAVILDEGQYIKNPNSQTAQVARVLHAEHRLVLSGTPIENRLMDLWSLMAFAMPGVLGSRAQFAKLYDAKDDPFARRRLSSRVRPFLLRRTKSQVAKDLPDRIEEDLFCEMEGEQKTLYRAELKRAQQMLLRITTQKQLAKERFTFLTSLLRLRQICCHPKLVKPDSSASSTKVEALLEQLEPLMEEGHKVLVFSQFVEMLDILQEEIKGRGWPSFFLSGATENRGELVQQFQSAQGEAIFLISLKAGGFGLNLTAANYVVLFDPWWNPAVENQAIDRTHRIGQDQNVIAYRLLIKDSIEEKIRTLQKTKSALADDVLGEEKFAQTLTLDDLHFLVSDTPA